MLKRALAAILLLLLLVPAACASQNPSAAPQPSGQTEPMALQRQFANVPLDDLVGLAYAPGSNQTFAVLRPGQIIVFPNDSAAISSEVFLDIRDRVESTGSEQGLLGLAFDPEYEKNGYFYVNYTTSGPERSVVSRFTVSSADPRKADKTSDLVILEVSQPYANHNGGQLVFGPDGYLYIGFGDGGGAGDPRGNGQNTGTLLGSILRIDVANSTAEKPYTIPPDNPLVGRGPEYREETWAYGFRNPWRFSFDRETGDLWAGDVGQANWEEIDLVEGGKNYGWNIMEGDHCYPPSRTDCDRTGLTPPIFEYSHDLGCSITGGYVYRGDRLPSLKGKYLYADYCAGTVWSLSVENGGKANSTLLAGSSLSITSFAEDLEGEVYVLSQHDGVYRLVPQPEIS